MSPTAFDWRIGDSTALQIATAQTDKIGPNWMIDLIWCHIQSPAVNIKLVINCTCELRARFDHIHRDRVSRQNLVPSCCVLHCIPCDSGWSIKQPELLSLFHYVQFTRTIYPIRIILAMVILIRPYLKDLVRSTPPRCRLILRQSTIFLLQSNYSKEYRTKLQVSEFVCRDWKLFEGDSTGSRVLYHWIHTLRLDRNQGWLLFKLL